MASSTLQRVQSCAKASRALTTTFSPISSRRIHAQCYAFKPLQCRIPVKPRTIFTATKVVSQQENSAKQPPTDPLPDLSTGFNDTPSPTVSETVDWTRSFHGMSVEPFPKDARDVLLAPLDPAEVEVKPDGILYLPEIKYRRILNKAFGPGAWGLAPRGETIVTAKAVTREYGLVVLGRLVSVARGEQDYFSPEGIPTAAEGCKSNALTRCCKDLGVASELWDPRFIRKYQAENTKEVWAEHLTTKKRKRLFLRKEDKVSYPWKEMKS